MYTLSFSVRPSELDSFGHVNNSHYLEYLEYARAEWLRTSGFTYEEFWARKLVPAAVEVKLRFLAECRYGDTLRIETRTVVRHSARIDFHQEIFRQDGRRAIRAVTSVVAVDAESRSLTVFPDDLLATARAAESKPAGS